MKQLAAVLLGIGLFLPMHLHAQEEAPVQAQRFDNVDWYVVSHVRFKPGMAGEAMDFIREHFLPVDVEVGRDVIPFRYVTGTWDHVVYFPIEDPGELAWETSPSDVEWAEVFFAREGGQEAAQELGEQYSEFVDQSETHLVQRWRYEGDGGS